MKVDNKDAIIKIRFDGFLSCLYIEQPRVVDWPDCEGTTVRYYACLSKDEEKHNFSDASEKNISSIKSMKDLKESGFLKFLESGDYEFNLLENVKTQLIYNTNILNSNRTLFNLQNASIKRNGMEKPFNLNSFYPYGRQLVFSQPFETLNQKRIKYYESRIKKGENPLAIALRIKNGIQEDEESYQNTHSNSSKYILDGHHKLVAYANLNINPSYILIDRISKSPDQISALPKLGKFLYYAQIENIITNGLSSISLNSNTTEYIDKFILEAPRLEDVLISAIYRHANYRDLTNNDVLQQWYKKRLETLKNRVIDTRENKLILNYYCRIDYKRKYIEIKKWTEIEKLIIEKL